MIEEIYKAFEKNRLVSTDSRAITKGSVFFAIKGDNFDGNQFVDAAFEAGCSAAVVSDKKYQINANMLGNVGDFSLDKILHQGRSTSSYSNLLH